MLTRPGRLNSAHFGPLILQVVVPLNEILLNAHPEHCAHCALCSSIHLLSFKTMCLFHYSLSAKWTWCPIKSKLYKVLVLIWRTTSFRRNAAERFHQSKEIGLSVSVLYQLTLMELEQVKWKCIHLSTLPKYIYGVLELYFGSLLTFYVGTLVTHGLKVVEDS